jgi:hypothetical protein
VSSDIFEMTSTVGTTQVILSEPADTEPTREEFIFGVSEPEGSEPRIVHTSVGYFDAVDRANISAKSERNRRVHTN